MDSRDGRVYTEKEIRESFTAAEREQMIEFIDPNDQTKKQRERGAISLHDHRSTLGKVLTAKRREMGFHRKR